jgi:hypothetical protein
MAFRLDSTPMLARLRASTRLAVLVLLIFALKIGAAAACAKHDFADLGLGAGDTHGAVAQAVDADGGDVSRTALTHVGTCSHCGCHHASALPTNTIVAFASIPREGLSYRSGIPPSTYLRLELRPPIA